MELYSFYRSTASFRVRIALNLKGLSYVIHPINVLERPGEHQSPEYRRLNPQALLPTLVDDGVVLTQSIAICEYLEERFPTPPLLPGTPAARAWVRSLMSALAADIHPLHALRVTQQLAERFNADGLQQASWSSHWVHAGLQSIEALLARSSDTGRYCHGDAISLADVFLVPQVLSAKALGIQTDDLEHITRIVTHCLTHPAFITALPANQATSFVGA